MTLTTTVTTSQGILDATQVHPQMIWVNPGTLVSYSQIGIQVNVDFNPDTDRGQPFVTVNTDNLAPEHRYDPESGLRGSDDRYFARGRDVVDRIHDNAVVATFYGPRAGTEAGLHAEARNGTWTEGYDVGTPAIAVHLNDAVLYDDEGLGSFASPVGTPYIYVVPPATDADDVAVFALQEDAATFAATFGDDEGTSVARLLVCDGALAQKMVAERKDQDEAEGQA